jgi:hypothetical protein
LIAAQINQINAANRGGQEANIDARRSDAGPRYPRGG